MDQIDYPALIQTANALADAARKATLRHFRAELTVDNKLDGGFDPVTQADRECEVAMRDLLAELRPDDGILGEEFGNKEGTTGLTWVLDPIDGTRAYMSGTPTWGVLIAVNNAFGPVLGLIDQPYIGERFIGANGVAQMSGPHGSAQLKARRRDKLSEATIFTTFPEVGSPEEQKAFHELARNCRLTRYGMDCYAYALLASGQIDLVVEAGLQSYDICAPIGVIEAAGGIVTNWKGGPAHDGGRVVAAASPEIHAAALEYLSKY
ncbi:histidinol-phosphatase [Actibacterium pelagium]|uniref:Histidinol-phosphatase n=1 Tax=Actibacterium pelagium TaxID=2029103 RepID=A0A917ADD8_9RHOB|nr:histidinol-phosphatase [Actibacterium pelagium]GGE43886.1 histidinol-phosphatase [Actibacterium pelagium]